MTPREVKVVPHNPAWKEAFEAEAAVLRSVLGEKALAVHHIGSTSVPGLAAKPIIDVLIEVQEIERFGDSDRAMAEKGYEVWGEHGIPGRRFFTKNRGPERRYNVHIFQAGTPEVERHLAFRDYLIQHPQTASDYARLKGELAREHPTDIESYINGKDPFVKDTERRAISHIRANRGKPEC